LLHFFEYLGSLWPLKLIVGEHPLNHLVVFGAVFQGHGPALSFLVEFYFVGDGFLDQCKIDICNAAMETNIPFLEAV
jgi:hypothetical protein